MLEKFLSGEKYSGKITSNTVSFGIVKQSEDITNEIYQFIKGYTVPKGNILSLVNAVGAGEYWSSNARGDYFTEAGLKHEGTDYGYKTFEYFAKPYFRHKTDPQHLLGQVLRSFWNDKIKRIFVLNLIDRDRYVSIVGADPFDDRVGVSMGCRVPEEICSICGYVNTRSLATRCYHLKYMMNHILPDGRKVYAINLRPRFHDITYTFMPADETSTVLLKVASQEDLKADKLEIARRISDFWAPLDNFLREHPSVAIVLQKNGVIFSPSEFALLKKKGFRTEDLLYGESDLPVTAEIFRIINQRSIFRPFLFKNASVLKPYISTHRHDNDYIAYRKKLLSYEWPYDIGLHKYASSDGTFNTVDGLPLLILENAYNVNLNPAREVLPYHSDKNRLLDNKICYYIAKAL